MEGFGITAIEGAACGRVVLASNLEGLKDAIKDGQNGILLEPSDTEAWIAKTKELLENDSFRAEFGKRAQEFVRNNFTWDKISRVYLKEMNKILPNEQEKNH